jgi:hypothetical protein
MNGTGRGSLPKPTLRSPRWTNSLGGWPSIGEEEPKGRAPSFRMCTHAHVPACIHTYTHTYAHAHTYGHAHINTHTYARTSTQCMHACMHTTVHTHVHNARSHVCARTRTHTHTHTHVRARTHTYACTRACIHMQVQLIEPEGPRIGSHCVY